MTCVDLDVIFFAYYMTPFPSERSPEDWGFPGVGTGMRLYGLSHGPFRKPRTLGQRDYKEASGEVDVLMNLVNEQILIGSMNYEHIDNVSNLCQRHVHCVVNLPVTR